MSARRFPNLLCAMICLAAGPLGAAGLVLEDAGERLVIPAERLEVAPPVRDDGGDYAVRFRLVPEDAQAFYDLTVKAVGQPVAIIVCGEVLLRPVIWEPIAGGVGQIKQGSYLDALSLTARLKGEEPCPSPENP